MTSTRIDHKIARGLSGGMTQIALAALFCTSAFAATCPTAFDPMGVVGEFAGQVELDTAMAEGLDLTFTDNPLFEADVSSGELPPVAERLPSEPLVILPYEECGHYGGTLEGTSRAPESGTSDILSWRQASLVRISDDLSTVVPNVAKSWEWNEDFTSIVFELRAGHKWSDGEPFGADDVVFFFEDIINNKELNPTTTTEWGVGVHANKIDDQHVEITFEQPFPGFLSYMATSGSYFVPFAAKHYYGNIHGDYNENADTEAVAAGFENWVDRFKNTYNKWIDAIVLTAESLNIPSLESHMIELVPDTQQRVFVANPYYFKVDSAGQQLPYVDRVHERFLNADLQLLAIMNGETDFKAQGVSLTNYPTLKENEERGGFEVLLPAGSIGPNMAFNITHENDKLREVYSDLRFRQAISHAINRDEINEVIYFGLGTPSQGLPAQVSFITDEDRQTMIDYDVDAANALLDEMGLARGDDGLRNFSDGSDFTILWEYSSQFASAEFVKLMRDYMQVIGLEVNAKELTSEATRENAKAGISDINMEWDVPYEPTLIADINLFVPYYSETSPLFGIKWQQWNRSGGTEGEEPPAWVKEMYELADEWKSVLPGSERYMEIGRRLVDLNLENLTIIGTLGSLPKTVVVSDRMNNVYREMSTVHFNFGYMYPYRPDQWFKD